MASGILGGGAIAVGVQTYAYTTPSGKTTTTSLLLFGGSSAGTVYLYLGSVQLPFVVPANGIVTLTGLILAAGQGVYLDTYTNGMKYLLTGWESAE